MKISKQTHFFDKIDETENGPLVFGGSLGRGRRKGRRTIAVKKPHYLVLKSHRARGIWSLRSFRNQPRVEYILRDNAKAYRVRLMSFVVMGNHIHIKVVPGSRLGFQNFLRRIGAEIALFVTKARKGNRVGKFWEGLAFTRILTSRAEEAILSRYFEANRIERDFGKEVRNDFLMRTRWNRNFGRWKQV